MNAQATFTRSVTEAALELAAKGDVLVLMLSERDRRTAEFKRKYFEDAERERQS